MGIAFWWLMSWQKFLLNQLLCCQFQAFCSSWQPTAECQLFFGQVLIVALGRVQQLQKQLASIKKEAVINQQNCNGNNNSSGIGNNNGCKSNSGFDEGASTVNSSCNIKHIFFREASINCQWWLLKQYWWLWWQCNKQLEGLLATVAEALAALLQQQTFFVKKQSNDRSTSNVCCRNSGGIGTIAVSGDSTATTNKTFCKKAMIFCHL